MTRQKLLSGVGGIAVLGAIALVLASGGSWRTAATARKAEADSGEGDSASSTTPAGHQYATFPIDERCPVWAKEAAPSPLGMNAPCPEGMREVSPGDRAFLEREWGQDFAKVAAAVRTESRTPTTMGYAERIEALARRYQRLCVVDEFAIRADFGCCQGQIDDSDGRVTQYGPPSGASIKCSGWWDVPSVPRDRLAKRCGDARRSEDVGGLERCGESLRRL